MGKWRIAKNYGLRVMRPILWVPKLQRCTNVDQHWAGGFLDEWVENYVREDRHAHTVRGLQRQTVVSQFFQLDRLVVEGQKTVSIFPLFSLPSHPMIIS